MKSLIHLLFITQILLYYTAPIAEVRIVSTLDELIDANNTSVSGDTILLEDGTYTIQSYGIIVKADNVTIMGKSGNRDNVIVSGLGMDKSAVGFGFWIDADNVTIADLTITSVYNHCIQTDVNIDGLHIKNCILQDAREQLLKVPYSSSVDDASEDGIVEGCYFVFTKGVAQQYYTGGVDCHFAKNWIICNNVFKGIRSPESDNLAEHAVHFWTHSEGTIVENNRVINCDRGIGFGLGSSPHTGGIIRNNMIFHDTYFGIDHGDVGIGLESCTGTLVYNNTIYFKNDYPNAIEYRFSTTNSITIGNNLVNKSIRQRDGASATVTGNITNAAASWFVYPDSGNLHINASATLVIDNGEYVEGLLYDFDGDERNPNTIDIGADEYSSSRVIGKQYIHSTKTPNCRLYLNIDRSGSHFSISLPSRLYGTYDFKGRYIPNMKSAIGTYIISVRNSHNEKTQIQNR